MGLPLGPLLLPFGLMNNDKIRPRKVDQAGTEISGRYLHDGTGIPNRDDDFTTMAFKMQFENKL